MRTVSTCILIPTYTLTGDRVLTPRFPSFFFIAYLQYIMICPCKHNGTFSSVYNDGHYLIIINKTEGKGLQYSHYGSHLTSERHARVGAFAV